VNFADHRMGLYESDSTVYTRFRVLASRDGRAWRTIADLSKERRDRPNAYVELPAPARARWVKYVHGHVGGPHLAVSDLRVFGTADGPPPPTPSGVSARRQADARNATVAWEAVPNAVGYNVLWGIRPDRLYQTYQRFADEGTTLDVRALTVGQAYWFAVEAFDERGVSRLSAPVEVP
jgi:xylan 1,4-beta-xylosidase